MFSLKKIASPAVTALLVAALLPAASFAEDAGKAAAKPAVAAQAKGDQAVAKVNGTAITRHELDRALKVMLAQSQVRQPLPPETMKQAEDAALDQLTAAELLYQEAAKMNVEDLDKQIAEKVAQNQAKFPTEAEFVEALKQIDMTVEDMRDFTRKDIIINNFIEKRFTAKAAASDAEARKFYDENMDEYFSRPEAVRASHILIGVDENAPAPERKKAREKAEALLKRIRGGEDFAEIAKADSSCPSATQGGDLGAFGRGQMVAPFEQAVFAMKPGEVSEVVETQFGYHIIKLVDRQEPATEKFENVKEKISEFLKQQKVQQELSAFIADLKKNAKIEKL